MLTYARQRAVEVLKNPRKAILTTCGPAGMQAGEFLCETQGLDLYLLLPRTADHLFNLENDPSVILLTTQWMVKGTARPVSPVPAELVLDQLRSPEAQWCTLLRVTPLQIQIRREDGWGYLETIDI